jgi:hypothetical protein
LARAFINDDEESVTSTPVNTVIDAALEVTIAKSHYKHIIETKGENYQWWSYLFIFNFFECVGDVLENLKDSFESFKLDESFTDLLVVYGKMKARHTLKALRRFYPFAKEILHIKNNHGLSEKEKSNEILQGRSCSSLLTEWCFTTRLLNLPEVFNSYKFENPHLPKLHQLNAQRLHSLNSFASIIKDSISTARDLLIYENKYETIFSRIESLVSANGIDEWPVKIYTFLRRAQIEQFDFNTLTFNNISVKHFADGIINSLCLKRKIRCIIFGGPQNCGKSTLARGICSSLSKNFRTVTNLKGDGSNKFELGECFGEPVVLFDEVGQIGFKNLDKYYRGLLDRSECSFDRKNKTLEMGRFPPIIITTNVAATHVPNTLGNRCVYFDFKCPFRNSDEYVKYDDVDIASLFLLCSDLVYANCKENSDTIK